MKNFGHGLTVRARLTLWNVGVLALVLVVLGIALRYIVSATLLNGMDREIQGRAHRMIQDWSRRPPRTNQPDDAARREEERRRGQEAIRDPSFPRVVGRDGKPLGPAAFRNLETLDQDAFADALAGHSGFSTVMSGEDELRVYSTPIKNQQGEIEGVLQLPFRLNDIRLGVAALDRTLLTLIPMALLVAGFGGAFLTARALEPVREITEATDQIEAQNLSGRLPLRGRDEFAELAARFNKMLGRLEAAFERQSRFTGDASHELRTPLAIIKANSSLALEQPRTPEQYKKALETIDAAADRSNRIVQDLLFLARTDNGRPEGNSDLRPLLAADLLDDVESLSMAEEGTGPHLIVEPADPDLMVCGDAHQLSRVFGNLVENALRHTPPEGQVVVSAAPAGRMVRFTVADTGEGIPAEHLPHVFERFYRVDEDRGRERGGTGLGLAIVRSIIDAHHGSIHLESELGKGTRVILLLPTA